MLSDLGWNMTAVAERLEPPELFEWFAAKREDMGLGIIPLDDAASGAIARVLRAGGLVGLLCDRDLQRNGIDVEFFGSARRCRRARPCSPCAPARCCLCAAVYSGPGRDHHVVVTPPVDTSARARCAPTSPASPSPSPTSSAG